MALPYRQHAHAPLFGQPTSRANFCEEDYIITGWIAEFVNTLTNIAYILYAIQGIRRARARRAPLSSQVLYYGLAGVGVCSALFHGLLKYPAQMGDDTSMQVATALVVHRAMTYGRGRGYARILAVGLASLLALETAYHAINNEQTVHDLAFVVQIAVVAFKTRSLIQTRVTASRDKLVLQRLTLLGAACFGIGYLLWQLDFIYCGSLNARKRQWGLPWSFLLELHGWWHVLTAVGAFVFISIVDRLTQDEVDLSGAPFNWRGGALEGRVKQP
ncbi:hypothetical protein B0A48_13153 [Cryoendolithus antarcticus]|uniref:Alkaline ceramidase 3 n=1 Tax=Cryoendolithus antarcticus TaxID=1507870 RepID=A0A1V8SNF1_9PEZI|nr:hypothetical protein B0A48_13153 [Cryoendolithus antarcticus]